MTTAPHPPVKLAIVDDDAGYRASLRELLGRAGRYSALPRVRLRGGFHPRHRFALQAGRCASSTWC